MLLARLPLDGAVAARAARYARSCNRRVRFQALMVQLSADPSMALRLMAEYPAPFSACEVGEILILLRRGMLPIAYGPLVESPCRNLRVVGLSIVRQFGIEEAERHLLRIMDGDEAPELGREALRLAAHKLPIRTKFIKKEEAAAAPETETIGGDEQ